MKIRSADSTLGAAGDQPDNRILTITKKIFMGFSLNSLDHLDEKQLDHFDERESYITARNCSHKIGMLR